jgi:hypothetical protein
MNALKTLSGIAALCFWFSSFFVWRHFDASRSKIDQSESGRIFPLDTHGSVVYLTAREHYFLYGLIAFGAAFFVLTVFLYFLGRKEP